MDIFEMSRLFWSYLIYFYAKFSHLQKKKKITVERNEKKTKMGKENGGSWPPWGRERRMREGRGRRRRWVVGGESLADRRGKGRRKRDEGEEKGGERGGGPKADHQIIICSIGRNHGRGNNHFNQHTKQKLAKY